MKRLTTNLAVIASIVTIGAAFPLGLSKAQAEENVTEGQIVRALSSAKKQPTRSLSTGPQQQQQANPNAVAETKLLQNLRGRSTRSLSVAEREVIADIAKDKPNIDLEITFNYNSANISPQSMPSVQALGRALTGPELRGSTFIVAGHTDAIGSDAYNQDLSERRADTIKRYLVERYKISATDLVTVGYGKSRLKDPSQPTAKVNRRVQVVNTENKVTATNEQ